MSKIEFEQISENEVEVVIPPETPMEMVQQLTKSFIARGLVEDLHKSTLSVRYFYRPEDKANTVADELIKSLEKLAKEDLPYWHPKAKMQNQARVRNMDIAARRAKHGAIPKPTATPSGEGPSTLPGVAPKVYDPARSGTVNYNKIKKDEDHVEGCQCDACLGMEKSGYGPKGAGAYKPADNVRRKLNNTGEQSGIGSNVNTKQYTSAKFSNSTPQTNPKLKRPQPIKSAKDLAPNVLAEIESRHKAKLKKGWGEHLPFPNAEEEIMRLAGVNPAIQGDDALANQLANMMQSKAMLNPNHQQPSPTEFDAAGEAMGLGVSEEMAKAAEQGWHGAINNWLAEATKPISQRFASEEEELAYWNSIKVSDRDDDKSSY